MRILVAGATGVLGRRVTARLLSGGHTVTALCRDVDRGRRLLGPDVRLLGGDALEAEQVARAVQAARPELLMHQLTDLSGGSSAANARLRLMGTRNLVDAAVAAGVGRVVVQSIAWCYEPGPGPATEDTPLDLVSNDPARRLTVDAVAAMESQVRATDDWVVLRNGTLYGPGTWYAPDGRTAGAARAGTLVAGPDVSSFVHVDDAAAAAVAALDWPRGVVNVVDDEPAPATAWMPVFCAAVGVSHPPLVGEDPRTPWARGARNDRARHLGWEPRFPSWRSGFVGAGGGARLDAR